MILLFTQSALTFVAASSLFAMITPKYDDGIVGKIILFFACLWSLFGLWVSFSLDVVPYRSISIVLYLFGAFILNRICCAIYETKKAKLMICLKECHAKQAAKGKA